MPILAVIKADPNIRIMVSSICKEIRNDGVLIGDELVQADSVILAVGMRAKREEVDTIWPCAKEVRPIGDCSSPRFILDAVSEAFFAAMDIR